MSAKQKDFFEDILEDRRHTSDIKWAMRTRDVTRYKYNKPRKPAEIKDHVLKSDRVKYAAEQVTSRCLLVSVYFSLLMYLIFDSSFFSIKNLIFSFNSFLLIVAQLKIH